ncbi:MAG: hypothetical protein NZ601_02185 [candidate division WOR-3 bacterium]|nr:hypothetical protein [candidate division WOR-3 bacterium]MCX7757542.1 hypothetical protein [candidate division WOR-3 bacterium]MDW7987641.1 hypothetical protein [candidate division WOR-3 bacterium]
MASLILLIISLGSIKPASDSLIQKAIRLFETRHENRAHLYQAKEYLEQAVVINPDNFVANYKLGQVYFTLGEEAQTKSEKVFWYDKGIKVAQRAKALDSNSVWGHFWYVANLGQLTKLKGVFSGIPQIKDVKKEFDIMMRLDSNNVWVLNALGNFYYELPEFLGGDINKALIILHRALTIDSTYSALYISLAKGYLRKKDYAKAYQYLKRVLDLKNPQSYADYILDHRPQALKLLKKLKDQ